MPVAVGWSGTGGAGRVLGIGPSWPADGRTWPDTGLNGESGRSGPPVPGPCPQADAATQAAERALAQAGVDRARVGVLINTSVSRDYVEPSTACLVHRNLGLAPECFNFDLSNACLGFLNGMELVAQMIERGQVDYQKMFTMIKTKLARDRGLVL